MWDTHVYTILSFFLFHLFHRVNSFLKYIYKSLSLFLSPHIYRYLRSSTDGKERSSHGWNRAVENGKRAQQLATQKYLIKITTVVTKSAAASITKENTRK